ncbi:MAG: VanW family protein [Patescibacteria group bacterium]
MKKAPDLKKYFTKVKISRAAILAGAIFVIIVLSALDGFLAYAYQYKDKAYKGVQLGGVDISGLTFKEIEDKINQYKATIEKEGVKIVSPEKTYRLLTSTASPDASAARDLIVFQPNGLAENMYNTGKDKGIVRNLETIFSLLIAPKKFAIGFEYDEKKVAETLEDFFQEEETAPQNANIKIGEDGALSAIKEKEGKIFPWDKINQEIKNRLNNLSLEPVQISLETQAPQIISADAKAAESKVAQIFGRLPLKAANGEKSWEITKEILVKGLILERESDKKIIISLGDQAFEDFFDKIAKEIEVAALDSKFRMENGKVAEFQASMPGKAIDRELTRQNIIESLNDPKKMAAAIITKEVSPQYTDSEADSLGIKELVAQGKTSFAGSPKNRRINIKVAADKLNGIIIKPGEIFSTITAVGPVDGKNGYLPELVIKGNRTVPEYGGGLCQIGTTFFRVVLNAGLPVLERRNHSYRVSYYEPPVGMDATIYEPKPDFRFTNDYATPLLLQARIEGDNLIFEFYGTKDDRVAESSEPRIYNYVKPGPKKIIETEDLKPGETKCIEKAHTGADAEFTYTVKYASGETKKETFTSHYKPWQEVCLVGKALTKEAE